VVVKVQYPEVAQNYIADFDNMETVAKLLHLKESLETIRSLRVRHEYELDFRLEAQNLTECGENAKKHGFSPHRVRIPAVISDIPATRHVRCIFFFRFFSFFFFFLYMMI
jgi:predicted unusual protein kinase regulating ubiquinone biosynthesis (AarF/ABC1/UbiB family)